MQKLQEAIYFKRVDFSDIFYSNDRRQVGFVPLEVFISGLKRCPITLAKSEIDEIVLAAPKDTKNSIYYKDFQRTLSRQQLSKSIHKKEISSYTTEKVASALNSFIRDFPSTILTIEDLKQILRSTWLDISPDEIQQVWDIIPHDKRSLIAWAKEHSVVENSFQIKETSKTLPQIPVIMSKLKEVAINYGSTFLLSALRAKTVLTRDEMLEILERFRITNFREDFNEFREWAIANDIHKMLGNDLVFFTEPLCQFFANVDFVAKQEFEEGVSVLDQILIRTLKGFIAERLGTLRQYLGPFMNRDHVEEIRLRETLKIVVPSLSNENVSLLVNSLKYTLPANHVIPFRQINVDEFCSLFDNSLEVVIAQELYNKPLEKPKSVQAPLSVVSGTICQEFIVKPRDYNWEKTLITKVYSVHKPLLSNFRINDFNKSGALTLEVFHYTLKKSLEWLNDEEILFLVDLGIRECGSIDEYRTGLIKMDIQKYHESQSISAAWFPSGEQYNISYLYFIIVLERLSND